jgi:hypothetical protein
MSSFFASAEIKTRHFPQRATAQIHTARTHQSTVLVLPGRPFGHYLQQISQQCAGKRSGISVRA